jgi:outer membrane lipoprotein carrier protein
MGKRDARQVFASLAAFLAMACAPALGWADPSPTVSPAPSPSSTVSKPKAPVAAAAAKSHLPMLLQDVETLYTHAATLKAEFTQVNEVAALRAKKTTSGVILVKRPDKLRWETLKPDMNLLVSDGRKFWFYTPPFDKGENGQVIERKSSEIHSKLANALLSGRFSVVRDMKIKQESALRFSLTPRRGTAGTVVKAGIEVDPLKKLIQKVTLEHKGGNRSEITLSKIELGKPMGDELFEFTPPPGTDKVTQ